MNTPSESQERVLRMPEVVRMTGLSRSHIYALSRQGEFPRIFKLSEKSSGILLSEVNAWIKARAEEGRVA